MGSRFSVALWNGGDPILKERLFGLANEQGNHGEDVKEYWWPLDGTPSHSHMRFLYRYPQAEFPYQQLRDENARRGRPFGRDGHRVSAQLSRPLCAFG